MVLGETEDQALLGAVTLETLGLMLNPVNRTLRPMRMVLARAARERTYVRLFSRTEEYSYAKASRIST